MFVIITYPCALFIYGRWSPSFVKSNLNYKIGSYGHTYSRLKEVKKVKKIDILFLGSSHAYRGFDTRIFTESGYSSFNLGSSAQTPVQTKLLLKRYLDTIKPKLVVYEVCPSIFLSDGIESAVDIIANEKNDFNSLLMTLELNHVKTYNTFLYAIICDFLNLNASYREEKQKEGDVYIPGGFVEKQDQVFEMGDLSEYSSAFNKNQIPAFKEIVEMLKERKINLVLVNAPTSKSLYNTYPKNDFFDSLMGTYSTYYNFNKILNLNDSLHFYNADHLNKKGVQIFDLKLLDILKK